MTRNISLDILKFFMAFMVVGLHSGFLREFSLLAEYIFVNGVFRIAVPVFLVINGYYFYEVISGKSEVKWFKRVSLLYLIWMFFYSYFWFSLPDFSFVSVAYLLGEFLVGYHHLWYISGMIGGAIILMFFIKLPFLLMVVSLVLFFFLGVFIQYAGNYGFLESKLLSDFFNLHWTHRNAVFFSYPFMCIGYIINKYSLHRIKSLSFYAVLCFIFFVFLIFESIFNFYTLEKNQAFDNYISLFFVCPLIFIIFLKVEYKGNSKSLALYSSSVYFIHSFILSALKKFTDFEATLLTVLVFFSSLIISYFIVNVHKRFGYIL